MNQDQPSHPEKGTASPTEQRLRKGVTLAFTRFEDVVYVCLGLMLAYTAVALIVTGAGALWRSVSGGAPVAGIIELLDRALLVLMIVELLYTVKVSFREHALVPEPFLVVSLIAVTRRILVVTAEFSHMVDRDESIFRKGMIEVGLLTAMVLVLVASLRLLRPRASKGSTEAPAA